MKVALTVFNSLYLHRYLSDRKVLEHYYYVLVPNRPKITLTDLTDRIGTPIILQAVGRTGRFRGGLHLGRLHHPSRVHPAARLPTEAQIRSG